MHIELYSGIPPFELQASWANCSVGRGWEEIAQHLLIQVPKSGWKVFLSRDSSLQETRIDPYCRSLFRKRDDGRFFDVWSMVPDWNARRASFNCRTYRPCGCVNLSTTHHHIQLPDDLWEFLRRMYDGSLPDRIGDADLSVYKRYELTNSGEVFDGHPSPEHLRKTHYSPDGRPLWVELPKSKVDLTPLHPQQ